MYVISLSKVRKNVWMFLRILVVLIVIGLVLPRLVGYLGKTVSPGAGLASIGLIFREAIGRVAMSLTPFVETLKQYYQGK